jgi:flagellar basal body-associated protein FliL
MKVLLRLLGVLLVVGALAAGWMGFDAWDQSQKHEMEAYVQQAEKARSKSPEKEEQKIADAEQTAKAKTTESYILFGAAAVGLIVGICLVLLPSSAKRKARAEAEVPLD